MDDQQYRAVRKAAEKRVKSRMEFYRHLAVYVMVNAMLILAFGFPFWMIFVTFGWGASLITHGIQVFLDDPSRRERAIAREMARLGCTPSEQEKPKRGRVRLADDGELAYEDEADACDAEEVPRRRGGC